jgi:hypothetical protein
MPRKQIIVGFDEIFNYAEKEFGVSWNRCCDIFHKGAILCTDEGKNTTLDIGEIEHSLEWDKEHPETKYPLSEDTKLGYKILIDFMNKHKLEEMYVNND